jgi:hypothetical protein
MHFRMRIDNFSSAPPALLRTVWDSESKQRNAQYD